MGSFPSAAVSSEEQPASPTAGDPSAAPAAPPTDENGQTDLEQTPSAEGEPETTPEANDGQTVLSQAETEALTAELGKLTPAMRRHVLEVGRLLESGQLQKGEVPRIGKLLADQHALAETVQTLTRERDEALSKVEGRESRVEGQTLPEGVSKLKTLGEIKARQTNVRATIRTVEDALTRHPQGNAEADANGEPRWQFGNQSLTRAQIADGLQGFREELDALPERAEQIQQQAQFQQARIQARAKIVADFPYLNDPENPDTKQAQQLLKTDPNLSKYAHGDYLALALARGHRELQAEKAARQKTGGNGAGKPTLTRPVGKVPAKLPHAPAGGVAARGNAAAFVPPKPGTRINSNHLEDALLAAGGARK